MHKKIKHSLIACAALALLTPTMSNAQTVIWESLFNTPGQTLSDDGGFMGGFYGGGDSANGNPFFQNDAAIILDTNTAGLGPDASSCLSVSASGLFIGPDFAFFGTFIQNANGSVAPGNNTGLNVSSADVVKFSLRLGAPGVHNNFVVKLEDVVPTGPGDFANTTAPVTPAPVDTAWTDYEIPLSVFTSGAQPVDPTILNQIVFEGVGAVPGSTINLNLLIDNIQFVDNDSNVSDWLTY